jgi:hypothetical protein
MNTGGHKGRFLCIVPGAVTNLYRPTPIKELSSLMVFLRTIYSLTPVVILNGPVKDLRELFLGTIQMQTTSPTTRRADLRILVRLFRALGILLQQKAEKEGGVSVRVPLVLQA